MPPSGPTPISFTPKLYVIAGILCFVVAAVSFTAALTSHITFGFVSAVFWVVVGVLAFRAARRPV